MIYEGDCMEVMAGLEECSVSAIVTDPPYDLVSVTKRFGSDRARNTPAMETEAGSVWARKARGFMGKTWDGTGVAFRVETWLQALRVAKPGAHLLTFGGTRTYHRLVCAIEDAGWEIRDCLVWAYASGFPKSLNLPGGLGTALKPAWEPIVLARKPLRGTVAVNVASYGTGALNIDGTRIGRVDGDRTEYGRHTTLPPIASVALGDFAEISPYEPDSAGRWPANVILTDPIFDGDTPGVVGGGEARPSGEYERQVFGLREGPASIPLEGGPIYADSGTYSRFFLIPKADRADREPVLGGLEGRTAYKHNHVGRDMSNIKNLMYPGDKKSAEAGRNPLPKRANTHPTVKPVELMRHLVRLVTPPGGTVLDPFLGSGTTAIAAEMEGFSWIGIEKEPEYVAIARARLLGTQQGLGLVG